MDTSVYSSDSRIRQNIATYYEPVILPGGYEHILPDRIQTNDLYYAGKFKTGDKDPLGFKKFFYQIIKPTCDVATKFVDLDTNNVTLQPVGAGNEEKVWFMERRLRQWMRNKNIDELLNEISIEYPKGHVVIKKINGTWERVHIQNLRVDPRAKSIHHSPFVYELVVMTRGEVESMDWDETAKASLLGTDEEEFHVYECYDRKGKKWVKTIRGELYMQKHRGGQRRAPEARYSEKNEYYPATILSKEETVDSLPYRELRWEVVPGRWLGFGSPEYLEDNQIATNEAENLERAGLKFTSLKVYQSRDESIGGSNLLTSAQNGDILKVDSEIQPIAMEERNLSAFNNTRTNWQTNTQLKTFTSDITTGANLPSRTPLGVANLSASMAASYFEFKRENFGIFLRKWIENDVMPDFKTDQRKQHTLIFKASDRDIEKYDQLVAGIHVDSYIADYAMANGYFPSQEQIAQAKARVLEDLKKQRNRYPEIPDDFYENAKYSVHAEITGEGLDVGAKGQVLQIALSTLGQNPAILQNPVTKNVFFQFLALGGVSPVEIDALQAAAASSQNPQLPMGQMAPGQDMGQGMGQMPQGGSVARPQATQMGAMGATGGMIV